MWRKPRCWVNDHRLPGQSAARRLHGRTGWHDLAITKYTFKYLFTASSSVISPRNRDRRLSLGRTEGQPRSLRETYQSAPAPAIPATASTRRRLAERRPTTWCSNAWPGAPSPSPSKPGCTIRWADPGTADASVRICSEKSRSLPTWAQSARRCRQGQADRRSHAARPEGGGDQRRRCWHAESRRLCQHRVPDQHLGDRLLSTTPAGARRWSMRWRRAPTSSLPAGSPIPPFLAPLIQNSAGHG